MAEDQPLIMLMDSEVQEFEPGMAGTERPLLTMSGATAKRNKRWNPWKSTLFTCLWLMLATGLDLSWSCQPGISVWPGLPCYMVLQF